VQHHGIQLSMDGKGAWRDNLFVERVWRSVKYEEVYLHAYDSVSEAERHLAVYLAFYNQGRPHTALDGQTPIWCTLPRCPTARQRNVHPAEFHLRSVFSCPTPWGHRQLNVAIIRRANLNTECILGVYIRIDAVSTSMYLLVNV
jgi:putative transposase